MGAHLSTGRTKPILDQVEMLFKIIEVKRNLDIIILQDLEADCLLEADFIRCFNTISYPRENKLSIKEAKDVPLELYTFSFDRACSLASTELADVDDGQRECVQELLDRVLLPIDSPLGCTHLAEYKIDVGSAKLAKQRYYPVITENRERNAYASKEDAGTGVDPKIDVQVVESSCYGPKFREDMRLFH